MTKTKLIDLEALRTTTDLNQIVDNLVDTIGGYRLGEALRAYILVHSDYQFFMEAEINHVTDRVFNNDEEAQRYREIAATYGKSEFTQTATEAEETKQ